MASSNLQAHIAHYPTAKWWTPSYAPVVPQAMSSPLECSNKLNMYVLKTRALRVPASIPSIHFDDRPNNILTKGGWINVVKKLSFQKISSIINHVAVYHDNNNELNYVSKIHHHINIREKNILHGNPCKGKPQIIIIILILQLIYIYFKAPTFWMHPTLRCASNYLD